MTQSEDTKPSKCIECGAGVTINKFASHAKTLCRKHKAAAESGVSTAIATRGSEAPRVATGAPTVLGSMEEVQIRSNARDIPISIIKLRDKIKNITVKVGSVVATALDQANVGQDEDVNSLDIRVNGQKASLLQMLRENDTIYIASKVAGA